MRGAAALHSSSGVCSPAVALARRGLPSRLQVRLRASLPLRRRSGGARGSAPSRTRRALPRRGQPVGRTPGQVMHRSAASLPPIVNGLPASRRPPSGRATRRASGRAPRRRRAARRGCARLPRRLRCWVAAGLPQQGQGFQPEGTAQSTRQLLRQQPTQRPRREEEWARRRACSKAPQLLLRQRLLLACSLSRLQASWHRQQKRRLLRAAQRRRMGRRGLR